MSIQFLDDRLEQVAARIVPFRCGRSEPRALKKRPKPISNFLNGSGMGEQDGLIAIDASHPRTSCQESLSCATGPHRPTFLKAGKNLARPKGLEPLTYGLEIRCSIQLS